MIEIAMLHRKMLRKEDENLKNTKGKKEVADKESKKGQNAKSKKDIIKFLFPIFFPIFVSIIFSMGVFFLNMYVSSEVNSVNIQNINDNISSIKDSIKDTKKDIESDIDELKGDISDVDKKLAEYEKTVNDEIAEINRSLGKLEGIYTSESMKLSADCKYADFVKDTYNSGESVYRMSGTSWEIESGVKVAQKADDGSLLTREEVINQTILLSYTDENGEEVYFSGQINENGMWNDRCIINRYRDNQLTMIMDAIYESGILKEYRQLFSYTNHSGVNVWAIAERKIEGEVYSGETKTFYRTANNEITKNFDFDTVTDFDILSMDDFNTQVNLILEGYYSGYTSDGYFNDDTGNAYLIKYDIYGFIRMLYVGRIKNGNFEDATNNAWYIVRDPDIGTGYMYYKGKFSNGQRENNEGIELNLSYEEIQEHLGTKQFNSSLNWYVENNI